MKKAVKNWIDSAKYDLDTAEHLFNSGKYIYTIFMCHLAIEKALKAKIEEITGKMPPKSHNLRYLVKLSSLEPSEDIFNFLSKLSEVSIPTRYPEDFSMLEKSYNHDLAQVHLKQSKEAFKWIEKSLKL